MPPATANGPPAGPAPPAAGGRAFGLLWLGQLVSLVGSGLTRFALGIWVYERTGSVTQFALISIFVSLPGLVAAPFAGALVDRWDRRWVLFLSDVGAGAGTLAIVALMWTGSLEIWHVYVVVGFGSVFEAFQTPAYVAATTLLVPKKHFGRVGGMIQLAQAAAGVVALPLAGVLYLTIGLAGVVMVDFATFVFAALTLLFFRIPRPATSVDGSAARGALWREAIYGWTFIRARPGLLGLLLYFAQLNLVLGIAFVLVIPLVSSFADAATLGLVLGIQSAGHLVGSVVMTATGGPRRRIHGVLASGFAVSLCLVLVGLRPEVPLVAAALFGLMFCFPVIGGSSQAIWQAKVPPDVQGRVFAVRRMIAQFTAPLAYLLAGPLADRVFEPMMTEGGALAAVFGPLVGTGEGRGIALIYVLLALPTAVVTVWGYLRPRVRNLETELLDAVE